MFFVLVIRIAPGARDALRDTGFADAWREAANGGRCCGFTQVRGGCPALLLRTIPQAFQVRGRVCTRLTGKAQAFG